MTKITCTRRLQFCAGHRVYGHESKCRNLHGHNYVVYLTAEGHLDRLGRVIDFGVLKEKFGKWIDENWDHGFLWFYKDELMFHIVERQSWATNDNLKFFKCFFNPTAENMAWYLLQEVGPQLLSDTSVALIKVRIYETENCIAEATIAEATLEE